jgi:hypothetical protein
METQPETPETIIQKMNQLWREYSRTASKETRNEFVKCQQWLSNRGIRYYQEAQTGEWKLL